MTPLGLLPTNIDPELIHFSSILTYPLRYSQLDNALCKAVASREAHPLATRVENDTTPAPFSEKLPGPLLVLIVEDNAINRRVACAIIQKFGCQVECVENGRRRLMPSIDLVMILS